MSVSALSVTCATFHAISWACIPFWAGVQNDAAAPLHDMVQCIFTLLRRPLI